MQRFDRGICGRLGISGVHWLTAAAREMQADGWWWHDDSASNRSIRRSLLKEMLRQRLGLSAA